MADKKLKYTEDMSFDFVIPLAREDLTKKTGINQYVVDEVFSVRFIPSKVQEFKSSFRTKGPMSVLSMFDNIYSILRHFYEVEPELREDAWDVLLKAIPLHANQLVEYLEGDMDPHLRLNHLNTLKMNCYLICQFIDIYEGEVTKPTATVGGGRGKKKAAKASAEMGHIDWELERERAVRAFLQLLQLNVNRLWDPPVVEEEYVNLITNCCYKLLENPSVSKNKSTRDTVFQLLGTMVKKYNHGLGCSLKIIQLLQHFEHLASPLATAVETLAKEFGIKSITGEIMREIGRMDPKDLSRDTSGTRAYSAFLVELAEKIPAAMLPSISVITGLLDGESYTMRNSVLGVLAEMLIQVLSKDGLDDKEKKTRDQFLDKLEDHVHDVHAFVRSKVLQLWLQVVNARALPLPRQHSLLDLIIGRLQDKSSQVRKYAIQLITALLRNNPFAAKLAVEELRENYEKEKEKLDAMMPDKPEESAEDLARKSAEEEWLKISDNVKNAVLDFLKTSGDDTSIKEEIPENATPDCTKDRVLSDLKTAEFARAVSVYVAAVECWPGNAFFKAGFTENLTDEHTDQEELLTAKCDKLVDGLKLVFFCETLTRNILEGNGAAPEEPAQLQESLNEVNKQQVLVQYLKDCMNFTSSIQKSIPTICKLLGSKNVSDVLESIDFFVTGYEFGVNNAMVGIRGMLVLIWSKEQNIKDAVVTAYKRLYLNPDGNNLRTKALAVANNLTALTFGATVGDLTSLEELVSEFVRTDELNQQVIQILWERFAMKIPNTTNNESRGALQLLAMAAGSQLEIVKSNIDVLVKEGLGPRGEKDFLLTRDICLALLKLAGNKKVKAGQYEEPNRLAQDHMIFNRLSHIVVEGIGNVEQAYWIPMAEEAVNVIYKLAEHPDNICGGVMKKLAQKVMTGEHNNASSDTENGGVSTSDLKTQSSMLTRLLSLVGHMALRQLLHLDCAVFGEMKRRHNLREVEKESNSEAAAKVKATQNATMNKSRRKSKGGQQPHSDTAADVDPEEEMGLAGAAAEDAEAEYIRKITETELVNSSNLLAAICPLLVTVCNNQVKYSDPDLRAAASLALAKFMMVSSEFCENHLQLLFTILEKSPHATIRANTIIALGDLNFRFPNLLEPWTPHLYARLRDESPKVRKNTLMVLSHLILNDMVKVKGQISELATCIVDDDERIAGLSKLFFHELARKGNAIYNIMPDMVSRLSDQEVGVEEDHFRSIMKYLFAFIQKDRQCESLVEKLCHRFRATQCERQWRDLAYCLSLLSYNEKSIRKLQENFPCFADKLHEGDVYSCFTTIINGAKKFCKPEAKAVVDEFEERLEQCHNKGVEDAEVANKASKATARELKDRNRSPNKMPGRRRGQKGKTPRKKSSVTEEENDSDGGDFHPARRGVKAEKAKPKLSFSSDEEGDVDEIIQSQAANKGEIPRQKLSDGENVDPNTDSPDPALRKSRHRSVNKQTTTPTAATTRARRNKKTTAK